MIRDKLVEILTEGVYEGDLGHTMADTVLSALRCDKCKHSMRHSETAEYLECKRVPVSSPDDEGTELAEVTIWDNAGVTGLVVKPEFFCALWEAK